MSESWDDEESELDLDEDDEETELDLGDDLDLDAWDDDPGDDD